MSDMVAGRLLAEARRQAGISQAELARRAGVPRSVVNAYERNHREPGAAMLARLLAAAGFELRIVPVGHPNRKSVLLGFLWSSYVR